MPYTVEKQDNNNALREELLYQCTSSWTLDNWYRNNNYDNQDSQVTTNKHYNKQQVAAAAKGPVFLVFYLDLRLLLVCECSNYNFDSNSKLLLARYTASPVSFRVNAAH